MKGSAVGETYLTSRETRAATEANRKLQIVVVRLEAKVRVMTAEEGFSDTDNNQERRPLLCAVSVQLLTRRSHQQALEYVVSVKGG